MKKTEELRAEMDALLRSLRQCDTQATAIKWMASAYEAMNSALSVIADLERRVKEEAAEAKGLVFYIKKPEIEIVQSIPREFHRKVNNIPNYTRPSGETVVYPDFFLHPGLKPPAKPFTQADNRKLQNAQNMGTRRIVRLGQ